MRVRVEGRMIPSAGPAITKVQKQGPHWQKEPECVPLSELISSRRNIHSCASANKAVAKEYETKTGSHRKQGQYAHRLPLFPMTSPMGQMTHALLGPLEVLCDESEWD